jgi:hypothetical protein
MQQVSVFLTVRMIPDFPTSTSVVLQVGYTHTHTLMFLLFFKYSFWLFYDNIVFLFYVSFVRFFCVLFCDVFVV